ncbi:MAG: OmpA family protein [Prevotella sp.]|nr:OmpA family protein [Prevotella sp.]
MKKLLMVLALASVSVAGMAQDEVPTEKYSVSTNSFWSNWFIQGNVTWNAYYYGGVNKILSSPFYKFPMGTEVGKDDGHATALGFSVALGKWFTPGLGLRTKANFAWLSKAFDSKSQTYLALNEQALFNLTNMLCGYDENRVWNFIPYAGLGVARNFDAKANSFIASAGLLNTFKLGKKLLFNVDLGYYSYDKVIVGGEGGGIAPKHVFNQFALELGITYNLGKATWNKTPDVEALKALSQSQIDALNAQLADEQAENARLKNMLANQKATAGETKTVTVKEVVAAPVSVFFNIGKSKIASRKDVQNVKDLVEVAKANNSKIVVTGYADSKTGSAEFNQKLSQKRAETVADELVKLGMSRDNIEVVAAGGVNTLTPISYNRRATVEIKK